MASYGATTSWSGGAEGLGCGMQPIAEELVKEASEVVELNNDDGVHGPLLIIVPGAFRALEHCVHLRVMVSLLTGSIICTACTIGVPVVQRVQGGGGQPPPHHGSEAGLSDM
jgi:hypothetical protein